MALADGVEEGRRESQAVGGEAWPDHARLRPPLHGPRGLPPWGSGRREGRRDGRGRRERGGRRGLGRKEEKNSDKWAPHQVNERYRGWMGAEKLSIMERISMTRLEIFFKRRKIEEDECK